MWQYMAQRVLTGEWLHRDLNLLDVETERALSGPGGIAAAVSPADMDLVDDAGEPMLQEWSTALYAVDETGRIRGAGILQHSAFDEGSQTWALEAPGWSSYPHGMPYEGELQLFDADPFGIVRTLWAHLQGAADGHIGMVVDTAVCPVKVGGPSAKAKPTAVRDYLWTVLDDTGAETSGVGKPPAPGTSPMKGAPPVQLPDEDAAAYAARVAAWEAAYALKVEVYSSRKDAYDGYNETLKDLQAVWSKEKASFTGYELYWWDSPDCGDEIDNLAKEVPFEYCEEHEWASGSDTVEHRLRLGYPGVGARRQGIRFVVGENVLTVPVYERNGDEYASHILGLGKGEGKKMTRALVGERDGRIRRVKAWAGKDVGSTARLRSLAAVEHRRVRSLGQFNEIAVIDHPNAPLGSFDVGDEILISVDAGHVTRDQWCRVTSIKVKPADMNQMVCTVVPSEKAG